jgi:hypothetical protein
LYENGEFIFSCRQNAQKRKNVERTGKAIVVIDERETPCIDLIQAVTAIDRDTKEPTSRMVSLKRDLDAVVEQVRTVTRKDHKPAF